MRKIILALAIMMLAPLAAQAQPFGRTAVSLVGLDTNNCLPATPCRTFSGALAKTAPNGEIICLDRGGFGGAVISMSVTIDCSTATGFITGAPGTTAIDIGGSAPVDVTIRGVFISGGNAAGQNGIRMTAPGVLLLDGVGVRNMVGYGVDVEPSAGSAVVNIKDSVLSRNSGGNIFSKPGAVVTTINSTLIDAK